MFKQVYYAQEPCEKYIFFFQYWMYKTAMVLSSITAFSNGLIKSYLQVLLFTGF